MSKIIYLDCFSGISGDMFIGALLDAGLDFNAFKQEMKKINFEEFDLTLNKVAKQHISASKFNVIDKGEKVYRHLGDLNALIDNSSFDSGLKKRAKNIFSKIASAEAKIHNVPIEKVHFHEVGAVDTIVDVAGVLVGLKLLGIEKVFCSRLNLGSGFIEISHGTYPVPAPATAEILKGAPVYSSGVKGELITPTGAAIVAEITDSFADMPDMIFSHIGYGAGAREMDQPNVLRVFIGEDSDYEFQSDTVIVIETNIDDMNPQLFELTAERLFTAGALDVFFTHILMKKNRPAIKLSVIANPKDQLKLTKIIFAETTSIGLRIRKEKRNILKREKKLIETELGPVHFKVIKMNGKIINITPEYEDCKKLAKKLNLPLKQVYQRISQEKLENKL